MDKTDASLGQSKLNLFHALLNLAKPNAEKHAF